MVTKMKRTLSTLLALTLAATSCNDSSLNTLPKKTLEDKITTIEILPEIQSPYQNEIAKYSVKYGIPQELFKEVIRAESDFDTYAVSSKGAKGLTQLMPGTIKDLGVKDPFDPNENINAGAEYLKRMYNIFKAEKGIERWKFAVAAYNAGAGHIIDCQKIIDAANTGKDNVTITTRYRKPRTFTNISGFKGLTNYEWDSIAQVLPRVTRKDSTETINHVKKIFSRYNQQ